MFYDRSSIDIFNHASGALSDDEYRIKVELERLEHIDSMEQAANYMLALAGLPFNEARALPFIGTDTSTLKAQQQKQREKDQNFLLWHLVYRFQQNLNRIDQRIAEIDKSLDALSELKHLAEANAFNKDNSDHKALLNTAGINPDVFAADPEKAIDERFDFVWQQRDTYSALREKMVNVSQNSHSPDELNQKFSTLEAQLDQLDADWQSQELDVEQTEPASATSSSLDATFGALNR